MHVRVCVPSPHEVEQSPHDDQAPSTGGGHEPRLHTLLSVALPTQSAPFTGTGFVQVRVRVIAPSPHVTEQPLQADQADHPPSIETVISLETETEYSWDLTCAFGTHKCTAVGGRSRVGHVIIVRGEYKLSGCCVAPVYSHQQGRTGTAQAGVCKLVGGGVALTVHWQC